MQRTKQKQQTKITKEKQKRQHTLNLPNPNKRMKQQAPNIGEENMFNTFATASNTPKTNHKTMITSKNTHDQPQTKPNISCFQHKPFLLQLLCFAENTTKKIVFRRAQRLKITVSNSHCFSHPRSHLKHVSFLVLPIFPWNHNFYCVLWVALQYLKDWQKQIVCTKMPSFLPSKHKFCLQFLKKSTSPIFSFSDDHTKTLLL